jgi:hypothetical protein
MKPEAEVPKCCGSQHFPKGEPSHAWSPQELGQYAQSQERQIVDGEKKLAPLYWQLGQALCLARKQFTHGQWCQFLQELAIDQTRASKAMAIFRGFATIALVEPLTVEGAYSQRPRTKRGPATNRRRAGRRSSATIPLTTALTQVARLADDHLQDNSRLRRADIQKILTLVATVMDPLESVRKHLSQSEKLKSAVSSQTS